MTSLVLVFPLRNKHNVWKLLERYKYHCFSQFFEDMLPGRLTWLKWRQKLELSQLSWVQGTDFSWKTVAWFLETWTSDITILTFNCLNFPCCGKDFKTKVGPNDQCMEDLHFWDTSKKCLFMVQHPFNVSTYEGCPRYFVAWHLFEKYGIVFERKYIWPIELSFLYPMNARRLLSTRATHAQQTIFETQWVPLAKYTPQKCSEKCRVPKPMKMEGYISNSVYLKFSRKWQLITTGSYLI